MQNETQREIVNVAGMGNRQWYSSASRFGDFIWTAGQVPARADGSMPETLEEQVTVTLDNLEQVLAAGDAGFDTLLKVNTYLADFDDFEAYNRVYVARLQPHGLPPRTSVQIVRFPPPMRIEIEAVAHTRTAG